MNVAIDARWVFPRISGIGLYVRELVRHLAEADRENRYRLLFDGEAARGRLWAEAGLAGAPNFEAAVLPYGLFSAGTQLRLPAWLRGRGVDVYHAANWWMPYAAFRGRPGERPAGVVTLHDLIPLLFPQYTPRAWKTRLHPLYRALLRAGARRAAAIVAPSESTRRDILEHLRIPPARRDRVVVVPQGVHPRFRPPPPGGRAPGEILFVGRSDPYKNLATLVEALARLRGRVPGARLRVVGEPDPRYREARAAAQRRGLGDAVEWSGYADDDALVAAYRRASVFALPSRYEGFGLPVLEAMACGTPVVCGNRSSLPEVAGDAALLVDPDDAEALAAALGRVIGEPALAADLAARGLRRAAGFSWRRTAEETLAVYRRAV